MHPGSAPRQTTFVTEIADISLVTGGHDKQISLVPRFPSLDQPFEELSEREAW